MNKDKINEELREIFISVFKHENFEMNNELSAKDVDGWDSLTHMIVITEIEKNFNIRFKLKELHELDNLGSLIELVGYKCSS